MNAQRTNLTTDDGLRIYDLEPQGGDLLAVAGPDGYDPSAIDHDDLPAGFRWLEDDEWSEACARAEEARKSPSTHGDLHDYASGEYLRPATLAERDESRASGPEGVILVRGRRCYVQE